jgi:DMSO reductase anchor subunit
MITALVLLYLKGCRNLNPTIWTIIIIFGQLIGPILFFTLGMKVKDKKFSGDEYDD